MSEQTTANGYSDEYVEQLRAEIERLDRLLSEAVASRDVKIERLRAALDLICGITLGERDTGLPAGKIHRICVDALEGK